MRDTHALTERLLSLSELTSAKHRAVLDALRDFREAFEALKSTEAQHVTLALESHVFSFEVAQAELASCRDVFVRLVRNFLETRQAELTREDAKTLDDLAFLAARAPLTTLEEVTAIRRGRSLPGSRIRVPSSRA